MSIHTDPIELVATLSSLLWLLYTGWACKRSIWAWNAARLLIIEEPTANPALPGVAMRRVRQQSFYLLQVWITSMGCVTTLFLDIGERQSDVRNFTIAVICAMGLFGSAMALFEQRTGDPR